MSDASSDIGLVGLAVMGQNLALNIADHGFKISVYNRTTSKTDAFAAENPGALAANFLRQCSVRSGAAFRRRSN